jgi:hypothetical protein
MHNIFIGMEWYGVSMPRLNLVDAQWDYNSLRGNHEGVEHEGEDNEGVENKTEITEEESIK